LKIPFPDNGAGYGRATRRVVALLFTAGAGLLLALINNNVTWRPATHQAFLAQLDHSLNLGTAWTLKETEDTNSALVYMIGDMADISRDRRLRKIVEGYLANPYHANSIWTRMLDPARQVTPPTRQQLERYQDYQRWFLYAVAPREVELTASERADMFEPDRYVWGSRTHQLLALILYRNRVDNSPAIQALINHLCEKIANEANWDIRVTDLYLQRLAFLFAAGRPDLVKSRWVERAMACQKQDGGWVGSWCGWGPRVFEFHAHPAPDSHATTQAVWLLYMLKYRYPGWIEQHYPSSGS